MKRFLDSEGVIRLLREKQGNESAKELADRIGVTPQYLSDVFNRRREIGDKIPVFLKLKPTMLYERLK